MCSVIPSTVTASRSGSVSMGGAADAGRLTRTAAPKSVAAPANDRMLRIGCTPLNGHRHQASCGCVRGESGAAGAHYPGPSGPNHRGPASVPSVRGQPELEREELPQAGPADRAGRPRPHRRAVVRPLEAWGGCAYCGVPTWPSSATVSWPSRVAGATRSATSRRRAGPATPASATTRSRAGCADAASTSSGSCCATTRSRPRWRLGSLGERHPGVGRGQPFAGGGVLS